MDDNEGFRFPTNEIKTSSDTGFMSDSWHHFFMILIFGLVVMAFFCFFISACKRSCQLYSTRNASHASPTAPNHVLNQTRDEPSYVHAPPSENAPISVLPCHYGHSQCANFNVQPRRVYSVSNSQLESAPPYDHDVGTHQDSPPDYWTAIKSPPVQHTTRG